MSRLLALPLVLALVPLASAQRTGGSLSGVPAELREEEASEAGADEASAGAASTDAPKGFETGEPDTPTRSTSDPDPAFSAPAKAPAAPAPALQLPPEPPMQQQVMPRPNMNTGGGSVAVPPAPPKPKAITCIPPNMKPVAEAVLLRPGMHDKLKRLCRNGTDWTFLDAVVDELRKRDRRWGYWCRRGRCNDPSHDVLAYYCGPGVPINGSDAARGIDFVVASCYDPSEIETINPSIGWGVLEPNDKGSPGWTTRGRFRP